MKQSIGERAVRSTALLLARRLIGYGIRFAVIAVLARRLSVSDFGIVAIAATCIGIITVFGSAGINSWIIYDREPGWEQRARSAWWLNLVLTAGQAFVALALVPVVVWIYGEITLAPVLAILIATFFIEQLRLVPHTILERQLAFRAITSRDLSYDVLTGAIGIAMAIAGAGVWSLVVPRLLLAPIYLVVTLRLANWTPGRRMYREDWRGILKYASPLIGSQILHTLSNDGDTVIVGQIFGKAAAGFYNTAYLLANLIGRSVTTVLVQVGTPALAKVKEANGTLGPACLRMYGMLAIVCTPLLLGMFAVAHDLVLLIYGPKWVAVTTLLRIFIVFTLSRAITSPSGAIFNVIGRTDLSLKMYLLLTALIFVGVGIGSMFGVAGVAFGVTAARIIVGFLGFSLSLHTVEAKVWDGFKALLAPTLAAGIMAALVSLLRLEMEQLRVAVHVRLAVAASFGVVTYVLALRLLSATAFAEMLGLIAKISPRLKRFMGSFMPEPR